MIKVAQNQETSRTPITISDSVTVQTDISKD